MGELEFLLAVGFGSFEHSRNPWKLLLRLMLIFERKCLVNRVCKLYSVVQSHCSILSHDTLHC